MEGGTGLQGVSSNLNVTVNTKLQNYKIINLQSKQNTQIPEMIKYIQWKIHQRYIKYEIGLTDHYKYNDYKTNKIK